MKTAQIFLTYAMTGSYKINNRISQPNLNNGMNSPPDITLKEKTFEKPH